MTEKSPKNVTHRVQLIQFFTLISIAISSIFAAALIRPSLGTAHNMIVLGDSYSHYTVMRLGKI